MEDLLKILIAGLSAIIGAIVGVIVAYLNYWKQKWEKREQEHNTKVTELTNGWRLSLQQNQQRLEMAVMSLETKINQKKECCKQND